jgi:hypothetical protein
MDVYHIWFDLKPGVRDTEFAASACAYLDRLKESGSLVSYRITRRKLGLGPPQLREWHVAIDFESLTQLDTAFGQVSARADPVESFHQAVNSKVQDAFFALYRDFPDPHRVTGQEKF